jgi:malate synthase
VNAYLDKIMPIDGSWGDATGFSVLGSGVEDSAEASPLELVISTTNGNMSDATTCSHFVGFNGPLEAPTSLLFKHNDLHIELIVNPMSPIGQLSPSGVADVIAESAMTVIMDLEDSVSAVDADDKAVCYKNWHGLMTGTLEEVFMKGGKEVRRKLSADRTYTSTSNEAMTLKGRALMLVRNTGHHMYTDAVQRDGKDIPEGFLDAVVTVASGIQQGQSNSTKGFIYVVKPKQHGPDEVQLTCDVFSHIEASFGLPPNSVKIGIMDEERRTSLNLDHCIQAARDRVCFINTGFLDRTGDEVHTSNFSGACLPKDLMKQQKWLPAYERSNVMSGLLCGLGSFGQVGKGMWAMPDKMAQMVGTKGAQLETGANTAWVPSPTAACLFGMSFHLTNVKSVMAAKKVEVESISDAEKARIREDLLSPPFATENVVDVLTKEVVEKELRCSCQSILGYVVRWIDQGIGCSKVPDLEDVGLMEDRATLRISCAVLQNWVRYGVIQEDEVRKMMEEMAVVVDRQNATDPLYAPLAPHWHQAAFQCALDLVFDVEKMPNGLTENVLHYYRKLKKAEVAGHAETSKAE